MLDRYNAALDELATAIGESVVEVGGRAPLGPMYAAFQAVGFSLEIFDAAVRRLVQRGGWRRTTEELIKEA